MRVVVHAILVAAAVGGACVAVPAHAADPPPIGAIPVAKLVDTLDRNGNGCVDLEEGRNYTSRRFHRLDRNGDGTLDADEAPPGPDETTAARPISLDDWQDAYAARFAAFDGDGSGCLDEAEIAAGRAGLHAEGGR